MEVPCPARGVTVALLAALLAPLLLATAAEAEEIRTVVVGMQARRNVDEGLALAMSDVVQGELTLDKSRTVFGRTDLQRVLEFESERQALGCTDDSCLAEVAAALDVDRIITGSMDKVGTSYFVVITEIDAQKVEPLGRVQKRLPLDEDKLIPGIQAMTRELLGNTTSGGSGAVSAAPLDAAIEQRPKSVAAGVVVVTTTPPGAEVLLGDEVVGQTPLRLEDVAPGTAELRVRMDEGEPVFIDVPVNAGEATEVNARIGLAEGAPTEAEQAAYQEEHDAWITSLWWRLGGGLGTWLCLSPGCGALAGVVVAVIATAATGAVPTYPFFVGFLLCGAPLSWVGLGITIWGLFTLLFSPDEPTSVEGPIHRVEVKPQTGEPTTFDVDAALEPEAPTRDEPGRDEAPADEGEPPDEGDEAEADEEGLYEEPPSSVGYDPDADDGSYRY